MCQNKQHVHACIRHWCIAIDTIIYNEKLFIQTVTVLRYAANNFLIYVSKDNNDVVLLRSSGRLFHSLLPLYLIVLFNMISYTVQTALDQHGKFQSEGRKYFGHAEIFFLLGQRVCATCRVCRSDSTWPGWRCRVERSSCSRRTRCRPGRSDRPHRLQ